jgi:chloramphenicol-sensitive protein RarD
VKTVTRLGGPGFAAGAAAYILWGLFPLYWPLLAPAAAVEILAHRIVWSAVFAVLVLAPTIGFRWVATLGRRRARLLAFAAVLLTLNWGTFIYGVNSGQVVEVSLGYFINPLITVALAVGVLHERLRRAQWAAVAIGFVAVAVLAVDYGRPPWIAIVLAVSFGLYGLIKKQAGVDGVQSFAFESALIAPPALAYLLWIGHTGAGTFTSDGAGHAALLASAGVVTAVPLMLFGAAAIRVRLSTLGLLQYLAPILQLAIGVFVDGEAMPLSRLAGFALVWVALIVFTADALRGGRERALVGAVGPGEQSEDGRRATEQQGADHVVEDIDHVPTVARVP